MHDVNAKQYHVDLHVHTRRYSPCAELLNPHMLGEWMRGRNLQGVVITEHDTMWSIEEIKELNAGLVGARIYNGVEVSSSNNHFVVIGLENLDGIKPGISAEALIKKANRCDAAVILVHHHMAYPNTKMLLDVHSLPEGIDAIEVASTMTFGQNQQEAIHFAKARGWKPVAGRDAHAIERVGETFTEFRGLPANEKKLAEAIKSGLGVPMWSGKKRIWNNKNVV